ncbi:uncharacterized protein NPIL_441211 [Nephila pilipes]|uniref:Uncharacterized protein n=1 Tax=Nephila pilipes TaxID=299642 RepID=A0A8X6P4D1_NEPPI|nr:uncharacterized protein NPIL_441211 [Nephila pilipes]
MSLTHTLGKISIFAVLVSWFILLMSSVPGNIQVLAGPNSNISVCHFCDDTDFSVRNLVCCTLSSRCCGPDRI